MLVTQSRRLNKLAHLLTTKAITGRVTHICCKAPTILLYKSELWKGQSSLLELTLDNKLHVIGIGIK